MFRLIFIFTSVDMFSMRVITCSGKNDEKHILKFRTRVSSSYIDGFYPTCMSAKVTNHKNFNYTAILMKNNVTTLMTS